jgi:hypothetical protein
MKARMSRAHFQLIANTIKQLPSFSIRTYEGKNLHAGFGKAQHQGKLQRRHRLQYQFGGFDADGELEIFG